MLSSGFAWRVVVYIISLAVIIHLCIQIAILITIDECIYMCGCISVNV